MTPSVFTDIFCTSLIHATISSAIWWEIFKENEGRLVIQSVWQSGTTFIFFYVSVMDLKND